MVNTFSALTNSDFNNNTNWTSGSLPAASETFYIQADAVLSDDIAVGAFTIYDGYTLDLNGYHLDASSGTGTTYIGNSTTATNTTKLLINAGELTAPASIASRGTPDLHITTGRIVSCDDFNWGNDTYDAKMYIDNGGGYTEAMSYCNQFAGAHLTISGSVEDQNDGVSNRATIICKRTSWQRMEPGNGRFRFRDGEAIDAEGGSAFTYLASGMFYELWYDNLNDSATHYHTLVGDISCANIINVSSSASAPYHPVLRCLGQKDVYDDINTYKQTITCSGQQDLYGGNFSDLWIQADCTVSGGYADWDLGSHNQPTHAAYVNRHWGLNSAGDDALFHASGAHAGLFLPAVESYIVTPHDTDASDAVNMTETLTISVWIKYGNTSNRQYIITRGDLTNSAPDKKTYELAVKSGGFRFRSAGSEIFQTGTAVADTWQHVGVVFDNGLAGDDSLLYIDGVLVGSGNRGSALDSVTAGVTIGNNTSAVDFTSAFTGSIADLRLFDEAKSAADMVVLAATNPATSAMDTYAASSGSSGVEPAAWWKLNTTGRTVDDGTRALNVTNYGTSGSVADGTNNNVESAEPWITMSSWRANGSITINSGYIEWKGRHSTGAYGEWGHAGATVDFGDTYMDQMLPGSHIYQVMGGVVNNGIIAKEWNIWSKTGYSYNAKIYGGSAGTDYVGLVDVTGNLIINGNASNYATLEPYEIGPRKYFALTADNIYVSGTLDWADSIYTPASGSDWATVLEKQTVTARDSIHIGEYGTYIATPGLTHVNDAPFFVNEGTFITSSGTVLIDDAATGGFAFSGADSPLTFYNLTISGSKVTKGNIIVEIENDLEMKNCTGAGPHWRPYGIATPTYVGGNVIVGDGCGIAPGYLNRASYTSPIHISGSLILNSGSELWLPNIDYLGADVPKPDFWIYGSLINNGGEIIETVGDWP